MDHRGFPYYLPLENDYEDDYEIYRYVEDICLSKEDKAMDFIYVLSTLHNKTTTYIPNRMDYVKEIYEDVLSKIHYLNLYYHDLQDYIETKVYMAPEEYLLIRHISEVYLALDFSKNSIEQWYQLKKEAKNMRIVLLHNHASLDHFIEGDKGYLINWDYAEKGSPIYDFLYFYKMEYLNLEMESLFDIYQSKYRYTEDEKLLFFSLLAMPYKVKMEMSHYKNTKEVYQLVQYVIKSRSLILKENKKYKEEEK